MLSPSPEPLILSSFSLPSISPTCNSAMLHRGGCSLPLVVSCPPCLSRFIVTLLFLFRALAIFTLFLLSIVFCTILFSCIVVLPYLNTCILLFSSFCFLPSYFLRITCWTSLVPAAYAVLPMLSFPGAFQPKLKKVPKFGSLLCGPSTPAKS